MKLKYHSLVIATALCFAACDDDTYDDWAQAPANSQEAIFNVNFSATPADVIDFANIDEAVDTLVKVFSPAISVENADSSSTSYKILLGGSVEVDANADGQIATSDLKSAVISLFGRAPQERTLASTVLATTLIDGAAVTLKQSLDVKAILTAPVIEDAYYYCGTANGWSDSDQTYVFTRADESVSVYDDPIFSCTIPASTSDSDERVDEWFKIAPASAYTSGDFWNNLLGAEVNGCQDLEANLVLGADCQSFEMPASDGAKFYRISLNMLEYSISIQPVAFDDFMYYAGDFTGWAENAKPLAHLGDGVYEGFYYIMAVDNSSTWGFKIMDSSATNWYGVGATAGTLDAAGANCDPGEAGFYKIHVDMVAMTYELTKIESISIIGSAVNGDSSWGTDADMSLDASTGSWNFTGDLTAGEYKFRANHDWALSWGGDDDALTSDNGTNRTIAADGNYTISFQPNCNANGVASVSKN